ncbi:hypothetical protein ACJ6WF_17170 [Streptomyces sp. MMS24-I2-30]|uniref:hypothetical protein n=1 Tax=Streptomyces sp. MMS24-I2-30 TaxID=3351564 RepID=UPI00389693F1
MTTQPITEQQLDQYAELAILADHGGDKIPPAIVTALVDRVRHLEQQRRYLIGQLGEKDAASGAGDRALQEFLAVRPNTPVRENRAELGPRVQCNDCGAVGEVFTGDDGRAYLDPSGQIGHATG